MSEEIATRRLGLNELNQKFDSFDALVDAVKEQMYKADRMVLRVNWFIGLQAWIIQSDSVYGGALDRRVRPRHWDVGILGV